MLQFEFSSLIDAPLEVIWHFHEREDILQKLTPPWQPVKVVRREGGLQVGAETEFILSFGLIPIRWLARHVEFEEYKLFVDRQIKGPMQSWLHRHQFREENGKTRLIDSIEYELPTGWLAEIAAGWLVDGQLQEMFRYRHQVTKRECERW
jgi:ligand-binding SRPBCC domain-containing protein